MVKYEIPSICAHCGAEAGKHKWEMKSVVLSRDTLSTVLVLFSTSTPQDVYTTPVLVGDQCLPLLQQHRKTQAALTILGAVLAAIGLAMLFLSFAHRSPMQVLQLLAFAFIISGSIAICVAQYILGVRLGSFDGNYFKFKNATYQKAFADANPLLVKKN